MSTPLRYKLFRIALLGCIVFSMSLAMVSGASANVRVPSGDMPFYAPPFCPTCITHNDEWAVIPFYRPTSCVPADFNLITLVDYPGPSRVRRIPPRDSRSGRTERCHCSGSSMAWVPCRCGSSVGPSCKAHCQTEC